MFALMFMLLASQDLRARIRALPGTSQKLQLVTDQATIKKTQGCGLYRGLGHPVKPAATIMERS